ncbi:unnamed protein product [Musa acuminata subsp. burmannicoides]
MRSIVSVQLSGSFDVALRGTLDGPHWRPEANGDRVVDAPMEPRRPTIRLRRLALTARGRRRRTMTDREWVVRDIRRRRGRYQEPLPLPLDAPQLGLVIPQPQSGDRLRHQPTAHRIEDPGPHRVPPQDRHLRNRLLLLADFMALPLGPAPPLPPWPAKYGEDEAVPLAGDRREVGRLVDRHLAADLRRHPGLLAADERDGDLVRGDTDPLADAGLELLKADRRVHQNRSNVDLAIAVEEDDREVSGGGRRHSQFRRHIDHRRGNRRLGKATGGSGKGRRIGTGVAR